MKIHKLLFTVILLYLPVEIILAGTPVTREVEGDYRDVRNNVMDTIRNRGLNIANISPASEMLNRTGPDFGFKNNMRLLHNT